VVEVGVAAVAVEEAGMEDVIVNRGRVGVAMTLVIAILKIKVESVIMLAVLVPAKPVVNLNLAFQQLHQVNQR
jgi:hypothetical protein